MKLPKHERIEYKCDQCLLTFKHINMYNEEVCYDCDYIITKHNKRK